MERVGAKWVYVDLARGLAALTVAAGHLRAFVFVDFKDVTEPNLLWRAFYFATNLGEQAVMVFFVMSGFLIGKSVFDNVTAGKWSWSDYAVRRLSRLWTVLIPALVLTAALDFVGRDVVHGALYAGLSSELYHSTPGPINVASIYRPETFLANLFFLQNIVAPTFGTNGPLWSLANEFWYYVIFPLAFLAVRGRGSVLERTGYAVAAVALCAMLPFDLVLYGIVWLFGFGVALASRSARRMHGTVAFSLSIFLFAASLVAARLGAISLVTLSDFACGASFAFMLYLLLDLKTSNKLIVWTAQTSAGFSYTFYLAHFPMLALLSSILLAGKRLPATPGTLALYLFLLVAVALYSYAIYLLFERNTDWVRRHLHGFVRR